MDEFIFILELIGTVAFASSGHAYFMRVQRIE